MVSRDEGSESGFVREHDTETRKEWRGSRGSRVREKVATKRNEWPMGRSVGRPTGEAADVHFRPLDGAAAAHPVWQVPRREPS